MPDAAHITGTLFEIGGAPGVPTADGGVLGALE